jgi:phosphoglycolate phosphatase
MTEAGRNGTTVDAAKIRGILFDKDGTLVDYFATWTPAYRAAAAHLAGLAGDPGLDDRLLRAGGYDPDADRYDPLSPLAHGTVPEIADAWRLCVPALAHVGDLEARIERIFHDSALGNPQPVTDLPALFQRLRRRGLKLGIATNDSAATAWATAKQLGIDRLIMFLSGYDSGHGAKPEPGMLRAFCAASGLRPDEVVVVGDAAHDFAMARAGGAALTVGVLTGVTPAAQLATLVDRMLPSIAEIESILGRETS